MPETYIHVSRVSCQKGPTRHVYAGQIGPFWQDTLGMCDIIRQYEYRLMEMFPSHHLNDDHSYYLHRWNNTDVCFL